LCFIDFYNPARDPTLKIARVALQTKRLDTFLLYTTGLKDNVTSTDGCAFQNFGEKDE